MTAQLRWLLECARLRNVEIQIMPTTRVAHSGLNGPMVLLETTERRQLVCIECQDVVSVVSAREEVSEFGLRYGMLRSQALDNEESASLIERVAGEYGHRTVHDPIARPRVAQEQLQRHKRR